MRSLTSFVYLEYPFKAPSIMLLTPNGRFELNKKVGAPQLYLRHILSLMWAIITLDRSALASQPTTKTSGSRRGVLEPVSPPLLCSAQSACH